MVGMLGCGCCGKKGSGFCNYESTTGSRTDEMNPPFGRNGLVPSDYPGSNPRSGYFYSPYTIEGWSKWLDYGNADLPWQLQQGKQFATPLKIVPPMNPSPDAFRSLYRPPGGAVLGEIMSSGSPSDVFFYSWDFKRFNYKVSADLYLPIAHAPQFNAVVSSQYSFWPPTGDVVPAFAGPELGFSGLFSECTEVQYGTYPMGPIVFIFLRRERFGVYPWLTYGPWKHYFYIWDKSSPVRFDFIVPQEIPSADKFTVEIATELVNVNEINTSNQPVLKYIVTINGTFYYQNTYTLQERNSNYSRWRPFCRCNVAASIWGHPHSPLNGGIPFFGAFPLSPYQSYFLRAPGWTYDPTEHFKVDKLIFDEIER